MIVRTERRGLSWVSDGGGREGVFGAGWEETGQLGTGEPLSSRE